MNFAVKPASYVNPAYDPYPVSQTNFTSTPMSVHNANKYQTQSQQSPDYYSSKSSGSSTSSNSSLSSSSSINQQSPNGFASLPTNPNFIKSPPCYNNISTVFDSASTTIRNSKRSFNECDEENYDNQRQAAKYHCSSMSNVLTKTSPLHTISYQNQYNLPANNYSTNHFNYANQEFSDVVASVQPTSLAYN